MHLPPRLAAVAALVPPGARLADIGTDHGLLPIELLERGAIRSAAATDIHAGPLERARYNAGQRGVTSLRFLLCDGLDGLTPGEADTVVIAGLGGENMADILRRAPWACRSALLILQPMSRAEMLRDSLAGLGLAVTGERLVEDAGRLYPLLTARRGQGPHYSQAELYTGLFTQIAADPLFPRLLSELTGRLSRAAAGLERSNREEDGLRLACLREALAGLETMRRSI